MLNGVKTKKDSQFARIEIRIKPETDKKLSLLALKYSTTKSELIRYAIGKMLDELWNDDIENQVKNDGKKRTDRK